MLASFAASLLLCSLLAALQPLGSAAASLQPFICIGI
ncbi:hypothetical protein SLEP1_g59825 [Rubroshorea leprosula]|uniref:Uncharacterized protein n=1 Tax=Rubroshorea leprosula TaxID=152421 RepID=A0AAV5MTG5_9ROSI|nr:hypothetical protein SLEP1_g59825 [Rubroshorea leprosula]